MAKEFNLQDWWSDKPEWFKRDRIDRGERFVKDHPIGSLIYRNLWTYGTTASGEVYDDARSPYVNVINVMTVRLGQTIQDDEPSQKWEIALVSSIS